jgi:hypothetical protein
VLGLYALYLLPYIVVSYYERYAMPLLGVKVLLVLWAVDRLISWRSFFVRHAFASPPRDRVTLARGQKDGIFANASF